MLKIIAHRRNTIEALKATPRTYGVEVDIRTHGERLIIHHDPFKGGVGFEEWILHYHHDTLILNVKEEGLEDRLLQVVESAGISDFFFLDQSFPFLIQTSNRGEHRSAIRVSEYEGLTCALSLAGRVDWVWVDCFTKFPLSADDAKQLRRAGFKLCLVSPELQGRDPESEIKIMRALLTDRNIVADAVCTKRPDLWS